MAGIQVPVGIDTVNPVPADYKYGPYANTATAIAAIPQVLRYDGLTVQITGSGNYWWLAADLSDTGLIQKGAYAPAIIRDVYLVGNSADAIRMGGTANNTYFTFQAAYDAANILQVALGANIIVAINVGVTANSLVASYTTAVGDLVLTADYNRSVQIVGISPTSSILGSISGDNASGNAFSINGLTMVNCSTAANKSITSRATGATGNGGSINIKVLNVVVRGTLDSSVNNVLNTTGNAGLVTIAGLSNINNATGSGNFYCNGINTSVVAGSTGLAGVITISNLNHIFIFGAMTSANNTPGGGIVINGNVAKCTASAITMKTTTTTAISFALNNIDVQGVLDISLPGSATPYTIQNVNYITSSASNLKNNGTGTTIYSIGSSIFLGILTSDVNTTIQANLTKFDGLVSLGNDSVLLNCSVIKSSAGGSVINGIGTGCLLKNTTVRGGAFSIANPSAIIVKSDNSIFESPLSLNVTIELEGGTPTIPDDGFGAFTWDVSLSKQASITLTGLGTPNYLFIDNAAIGQTYIVNIINSTGTDTVVITNSAFTITTGIAQAGSSGGKYVPTATAGAIDRLLITFDGTNYWVAPQGQDFVF